MKQKIKKTIPLIELGLLNGVITFMLPPKNQTKYSHNLR